MTTKSKKQARTTPRKKKLTLNKETVRDLSAGEKGRAARGGRYDPTAGEHCYFQHFGTLA